MLQWNVAPEIQAFWRPNIANALDWIINEEITHRQNIRFVYNEIEGQTKYKSKAGDFIIKARADRIEETEDGAVNVIDYKTGYTPTSSAVKNGFAPQLPLEALIASDGGFANLQNRKINSLSYWKIADKTVDFNENETAAALENTQKRIFTLIEDFDDENTPYYSHPHPSHISANKDYDHLSRFLEWSLKDTEGDNNDS